jgi:hypothetical protein
MVAYGQGGQTSITKPSIAVPGLVNQRVMTKEVVNLMGSAAQVVTITIGAPAPATLYSIVVNGASASFTTPAAITAADLQALIIERLSVLPEVSGNYKIEPVSTTGVKLTAFVVGFDAVVAIDAPMTFTNATSKLSGRVAFGRIVTGRAEWKDGLQVAGLPTAATEKVLGATQFSHGLAREVSGPNGFSHGDAMSLVTIGQVWMEFGAMVVNPPAGSALYYKSTKTAADQESGKLYFGATPPADYTVLPGVSSLDSEPTTIADGRVVGLVTLSV